MTRLGLIYVLPEFDDAISAHLAHNYELLEVIGQFIDIYLIVLKGESPTELGGIRHCHVMSHQNSGITLPKVVEFARVVGRAMRIGYRTLYSHYSTLGIILGSMLLRPVGGRTYYWHCYAGREYLGSDGFSKWRGKNRDTWVSLQLASYYVAGTEGLGRAYAEAYGFPRSRVIVIPNWVNTDRFHPATSAASATTRHDLGIPAQYPIVLFVHRLVKSKGALRLPTIAQLLGQQGPDAFFVVVGDGDLRGQVERDVVSLGLADRFRFMGDVPNSRLPTLYNLADVLIMPSEREGFPHVVLEALATGTPMVVTDVGGMREILPPVYGDYIVPLGDLEGFVAKMTELLADQARRYQLAEAGREWVMTWFSLNRVKEQFLETVVSRNR